MPKPVHLTYQGMTLTLREWSALIGVPIQTVRTRYRVGLPVDKILSRIALPKGRPVIPHNVQSIPNKRAEKLAIKKARDWHYDTPCPRTGHNAFLTIDDDTRSIAEWSAISGVSVGTIKDRLSKGRDPREAIRPVHRREKNEGEPTKLKTIYARRSMLSLNGRTMTVEDWARAIEVPFVDLLRKLNSGEPVEACLAVECPPQPARWKVPQAKPARPRMRVPTLAELDAMREAA